MRYICEGAWRKLLKIWDLGRLQRFFWHFFLVSSFILFLFFFPKQIASLNQTDDMQKEVTLNGRDSTGSIFARNKPHFATICLSPGHPSYEGDKYYEAIINRKVAYLLRFILKDAGFKVVMSIEDLNPRYLFSYGFDNENATHWNLLTIQTPAQKAERCNELGANYVISIHHNYAYDGEINHTVVFYGMDESYQPEHAETIEWAKVTAQRLGQVMKTDQSRYFADMHRLGFPLGIIVNSEAPTILVEGSFYSNPKERKRLNNDDYLEQEAQAIFDAFHMHYSRTHLQQRVGILH